MKMEKQEITTESSQETQRWAGELISRLLAQHQGTGALLLCLWGDLGAGKTTFAQGIGRALGVKEVMSSPTFLILKQYPLRGEHEGRNLYHLDAYRLASPDDLLELGWQEILADSGSVVVVEWPERIADILPAERVDINFRALGGNERRITWGAGGI